MELGKAQLLKAHSEMDGSRTQKTGLMPENRSAAHVASANPLEIVLELNVAISPKVTWVGDMSNNNKEIISLNELVRLISNCDYEEGFQDLVNVLKYAVADHDHEEHIRNGGY